MGTDKKLLLIKCLISFVRIFTIKHFSKEVIKVNFMKVSAIKSIKDLITN